LNAADQVPVSVAPASPFNDNCAVPSPEMASLIEPDQFPAGETGDGGVASTEGATSTGGVGTTSVGDVGETAWPQPATAIATVMSETNRAVIR